MKINLPKIQKIRPGHDIIDKNIATSFQGHSTTSRLSQIQQASLKKEVSIRNANFKKAMISKLKKQRMMFKEMQYNVKMINFMYTKARAKSLKIEQFRDKHYQIVISLFQFMLMCSHLIKRAKGKMADNLRDRTLRGKGFRVLKTFGQGLGYSYWIKTKGEFIAEERARRAADGLVDGGGEGGERTAVPGRGEGARMLVVPSSSMASIEQRRVVKVWAVFGLVLGHRRRRVDRDCRRLVNGFFEDLAELRRREMYFVQYKLDSNSKNFQEKWRKFG